MSLTALLAFARWREVDANGVPLAGAKLNSYESQTTTRLPLYADSALTTALSNPVIADAGGLFPEMFALPQSYSLTLTDADDVLIWDADDVVDVGATLAGLTQTKFCTTTTTATANTTLANITGLTGFTLTAATTYQFEASISGTSGGSGGLKLAFKYTTATLTGLESAATGFTASAVVVQHVTSTTDQASLFAQTAAVILVRITGRIIANAAGTLSLQMAQNASDAAATSVYAGSYLKLFQVS